MDRGAKCVWKLDGSCNRAQSRHFIKMSKGSLDVFYSKNHDPRELVV